VLLRWQRLTPGWVAPVLEIDSNNLSMLLDVAGMGPDDLRKRFQRLIMAAQSEMKRQVRNGLNTTARDYMAAIQPARLDLNPEDGKMAAAIDLVGGLPNMIEHGAPPWDLRNTLLRPGTRKLRVSKTGHYYLSVRFRHSDPTTAGQVGTPAGQQHSKDGQRLLNRGFRGRMDGDDARTMGRAAIREAQQLAATRSGPAGTEDQRRSQDALRKLAANYAAKGNKRWADKMVTAAYNAAPRAVQYGDRIEEGHAPILRARHATDLFAGMVRETKTYEKATQAQYATFRTISNNPKSYRYDDEGGSMERNWTHPGFTARGFFFSTMRWVNDNGGAFFQ